LPQDPLLQHLVNALTLVEYGYRCTTESRTCECSVIARLAPSNLAYELTTCLGECDDYGCTDLMPPAAAAVRDFSVARLRMPFARLNAAVARSVAVRPRAPSGVA